MFLRSTSSARALLMKAGFDSIRGRGKRTLELTYHIALSDYKLRGEMLNNSGIVILVSE